MALKVIATVTLLGIIFLYFLLLILTFPSVCWFKNRPDDASRPIGSPRNGFIRKRSFHSCQRRIQFHLIPMPRKIEFSENFQLKTLPKRIEIKSSKFLGFVPFNVSDSGEFILTIDYKSESNEFYYPEMNLDESYKLEIHSESRGSLTASNYIGILRGLSTFEQLLTQKRLPIPVEINDNARFPWRGLLLDVSRHFISIETIRKIIDKMFIVKMNVLHLHLSDDQGFRFESKIFNKLHDQKNFYSQIEIKQIIEYARRRAVRIVPEFDVPGHTTSWFVGYPELSSDPQISYKVEPTWGVMNATMDVTKNSTYNFLEKFFTEVIEIFPDSFFHIGGDETVPFQWANSETIRDFMWKNKIRDFRNLQAFFNRRIENFLTRKNRTMIGWDEIHSSQLSPKTIVQVWRGKEQLNRAVHDGYRAIVSHGFYLDHMEPARFHYENDLETDWPSLSKMKNSPIGGEACLWTEFIDDHTVDSRLWPRTASIAERLWSNDIDEVECMYKRLDFLDKNIFRSNEAQFMKDLANLASNATALRILADFCEPLGLQGRNHQLKYTKDTPLNRLVDILPPESQSTRKFIRTRNLTKLHLLFSSWVENEIFLQSEHQEILQLSHNLARVGEFAIQLLHLLDDPRKTRIVSSRWYNYHLARMKEYELDVPEIRLAAVRVAEHLLMELDPCVFDLINLILLLICPALALIAQRLNYIQKRIIRPVLRRFHRWNLF